jgi:hypothetical protein
MNWIYVDRSSYELKFGTRQFSEGNLTGPFDCTRQDRRLTFGGWEGFVAVQEGPFWALYFDRDCDKLKEKLPEGTVVLEIELVRKETRTERPKMPDPGAEGTPEKTPEQTPEQTPGQTPEAQTPEARTPQSPRTPDVKIKPQDDWDLPPSPDVD